MGKKNKKRGLAGRPRVKNPKNKTIRLRITEQEYQDLKDKCIERGISITTVIAEGIENFMNKP